MQIKPKPMTRKEAWIREHAARQHLRLSLLRAKCGVTRSVFYRVVRGDAKSARCDAVIARALGVTVDSIREVENG
jgi:AraC-like DNA-binding protein